MTTTNDVDVDEQLLDQAMIKIVNIQTHFDEAMARFEKIKSYAEPEMNSLVAEKKKLLAEKELLIEACRKRFNFNFNSSPQMAKFYSEANDDKRIAKIDKRYGVLDKRLDNALGSCIKARDELLTAQIEYNQLLLEGSRNDQLSDQSSTQIIVETGSSEVLASDNGILTKISILFKKKV